MLWCEQTLQASLGILNREKVQFHFNLTHLILEDSCVEMLIVQTTGT